ncbi:hypothetical protein EIP86_002649 [Pleurotus ostreatoroseus]|nr:hypothetical protein EIP86_002649 [Pleurotus ostreatoroseus]
MNLRRVFLHDDGDDVPGSSHISSIRFAASIVGNVGAPLSFSEDDESEQIQHWRSVDISDDPVAVGLSCSEDHNAAWSNETASYRAESSDLSFEKEARYRSMDKEHRPSVANSGDDEDQIHEEQALISNQE